MTKDEALHLLTSQTTKSITESSLSSSTSTSLISSKDERLSLTSATLLIVAECVGTGVLALPHFCYVLPKYVGLSYLYANYLVNIYSGGLLVEAAGIAEGGGFTIPRDLVSLAGVRVSRICKFRHR